MSKKALRKITYNLGLMCVLSMAVLFAYRIITFSTSESMAYLVSRLGCLIFMILTILSTMTRKGRVIKPVITAVVYIAVVSVNILFLTRTSINDFTDAILWPTLFIATYLMFSKKQVSQQSFYRYLLVVQIISLAFSLLLVVEHLAGIIPGTSEMFPTYILLALCPFALYEIDTGYNRKFNLFFLGFSFVIMIMTSKRSCIIVIAVGIITYYLIKAFVYGNNIRSVINKVAKYVIAVLLIFAVLYFVMLRFNPVIIERLNSMISGDTNGRDVLWESVINAYNSSPIDQKILGHGYHAFRLYNWGTLSQYLGGNLAHNDYLNTLYDYGIVGLTVYIIFLLCILKEFIWLFRTKNPIAPAYSFSVVMMLVLTFVSYLGVESRIINYVAIFWGFCLANRKQNDVMKVG